MKTMKKIIAVLICIIMLIGVMPVVSSSAAGEYITLDEYNYFYCTPGDYEFYVFVPSTSGYYRFFTVGDADTYTEAAYYDNKTYEYYYVAEDDDSGVGYNCNMTMYLQKGVEYSFYVSTYDSYDSAFYSCLTKVSSTSTTGMAQKNSYEVELTNENNSKFFKYIPRTSGYYVFDSEDSYDSYGILYDSNWNVIAKSDDEGYTWDFYLQAYLEAGNSYYLEATQYDAFAYDYYTVSVSATDVITDVRITQIPDDTTCIYDYAADRLCEDSINLDGLKVQLLYSNGDVKYWELGDDYIEGSNLDLDWFYDDYGDVYYKIWTPFDYDYFYLQLIENPIRNITVKSAPKYSYYENTNGYFDTGYDYDADTEVEYFYYYLPYLDEVELLVEFTDGSTKTMSPYDLVDGREFSIYTTQDGTEPWTVGTNNDVYIEFYGRYVTVPVEIIKNPVKSIVLNSAPTAVYKYGDEENGVLYEDGEYFFVPYELDGISMTVKYTDGTSKTFDASDFEFDYWGGYTVEGLPVYVDYISTYGPGTYEATMNFCGYEVNYDVNLVDFIKGDVDLDNEVSVMDATAIQLYKASKLELSDSALTAADVDNDNSVSVMDATRIQMFLASKIESL